MKTGRRASAIDSDSYYSESDSLRFLVQKIRVSLLVRRLGASRQVGPRLRLELKPCCHGSSASTSKVST